MIFDLNLDYVGGKVLPRLVAEYSNPGGGAVYDVSVSWAGPHGPVIFSTRSDHSSVAVSVDATAGMFSGEPGGSPCPGRGRGRFHDDTRLSRWTVAVRRRAGSLDIAVAKARTRNLVASLLLVGLLGGTA